MENIYFLLSFMFIVLLKYVFIYVCYGKNINLILFCYICSVLMYFVIFVLF